MKLKYVLFAILISSLLSCDNQGNNEESVFVREFQKTENLIYLTTVDHSTNNAEVKIPLVYTCFDPDIDSDGLFPDEDNVDCFSFRIQPDGTLKPTFKKDALRITSGFMDFVKSEQESFETSQKNRIVLPVSRSEKPRWWQYDATPVNSKGEKMEFVCQLELGRIFGDDAMMYVFYDKTDQLIKYIYQRD